MTNHERSNLTMLSNATALALLGLLPLACSTDRGTVYAITGTSIGVQIHQKDAEQTPEVKIGYNRVELAIVPTDRIDPPPKKGKKSNPLPASGSASHSAEVLMEINAQGSLALGSVYQGGVYQRLAVGKIAVSQPGAAFMMAKNADGKLEPGAAEAVQKATAAVKALPTPTATEAEQKSKLMDAFNKAASKDSFENAAKAAGCPTTGKFKDHPAFRAFISESHTPVDKITMVQDSLKLRAFGFDGPINLWKLNSSALISPSTTRARSIRPQNPLSKISSTRCVPCKTSTDFAWSPRSLTKLV